MTDDELIDKMKAAFDSVADSGMWTWDAAMRAVLALVREHDGAELAAVRAERDAEKVRADYAWKNTHTIDAARVKAEAEAARLRDATERALEMLAHLGIGAAEAELRAALAQEGGR